MESYSFTEEDVQRYLDSVVSNDDTASSKIFDELFGEDPKDTEEIDENRQKKISEFTVACLAVIDGKTKDEMEEVVSDAKAEGKEVEAPGKASD